MRVLIINEGYYINIDKICCINYAIEPFIKIIVNGNKFYDLRYTEKHFDKFCKKLVEKILDDNIKIVDMRDIRKEVNTL